MRESGEPERVFDDLRYRTRETWSRERRVVGRAEILARGPNPHFVVTSLAAFLESCYYPLSLMPYPTV